MFLDTDDSRPDIQGGHSMNVVYNLRKAGGTTPEAGGFFNFKALKWLKIGTKHLKNAKINNTNVYYNFSRRFFKTYFSTGGGGCAPIESPVFLDMSVHCT